MRTKVLKKVVQVNCPIQWNGIDCRLFAVVICLHIFEGTHIGPHIFTQYEIMKLTTLLACWLKTGMKGIMTFVLFLTT